MKVGDLIRIKEDPKCRPGQEEHFAIIIEDLDKGVFWTWAYYPTIGNRMAFSDSIEVLSESR
tara:strand:- start:193 stop:378 length:186 start_codon:yes stop_codon:yes gene_type:complete